MSRLLVTNKSFELLEPYEGKLSRTVLRGESSRKGADLLDDYVITVCGDANESCPTFIGKVGKRLHIAFDDPSHATGTLEFIDSEFRRVRDEIRNAFARFYITEIRKEELPKCSCGGNC